MCRKATGSASNTATFVKANSFRWLSGQSKISSFQKLTGYRNDFCSVCGSLVPNQLRDTGLVWVPAGLLNNVTASQISIHLHLSSSASWASESDGCVRLDVGPDSLESLNLALQKPIL
nr:GFA family protein [Halomonas sp.]